MCFPFRVQPGQVHVLVYFWVKISTRQGVQDYFGLKIGERDLLGKEMSCEAANWTSGVCSALKSCWHAAVGATAPVLQDFSGSGRDWGNLT